MTFHSLKSKFQACQNCLITGPSARVDKKGSSRPKKHELLTLSTLGKWFVLDKSEYDSVIMKTTDITVLSKMTSCTVVFVKLSGIFLVKAFVFM